MKGSSTQQNRSRSRILYFSILLAVPIICIVGLLLLFHNLPVMDAYAKSIHIRISKDDKSALDLISSTKSVLFYLTNFDNELANMRLGGAGGEITMFNSLLDSFHNLPEVHVHVVPGETEAEEIDLHSFDIVILDQYRLPSFLSLFPTALQTTSLSCKMRFVDFWGTPPEQNHISLDLKQFLVPYPNAWNYFIGFKQPLIGKTIHESVEKPIGVIHGKLGRYIEGHQDLIETVSNRWSVKTTIPQIQYDRLGLSNSVENLGICNSSQWRQLLSKAAFVLSLGDPVLAPTAIESLASGTPYIFAKYSKGRSLADLPLHPIQTQHDYMLTIGAPYAYAVDMSDVEAVLVAIETAVNNPIEPWIPDGFTDRDHEDNCRQLINKKLCEK